MATSSSSEQQFWTPREASQGVEVVPSAEVGVLFDHRILRIIRCRASQGGRFTDALCVDVLPLPLSRSHFHHCPPLIFAGEGKD